MLFKTFKDTTIMKSLTLFTGYFPSPPISSILRNTTVHSSSVWWKIFENVYHWFSVVAGHGHPDGGGLDLLREAIGQGNVFVKSVEKDNHKTKVMPLHAALHSICLKVISCTQLSKILKFSFNHCCMLLLVEQTTPTTFTL